MTITQIIVVQFQRLTLTRVVFEFEFISNLEPAKPGLTLTRVVFEFGIQIKYL